MKNLITIIREEYSKLLNENNNVDWDLYELKDELFNQAVEGFLRARNGSGEKQPWQFLPFPRLKKIWEDYIRYGFVRDVKGLDIIEAIMIQNTVKLWVNTELSGHVEYSVDDELERFGITYDDLWNYDNGFTYDDYMRSDITNISDYGLKPLLKLLEQLYQQSKPEDKLVTIDKMLNVIHHTSDLANIFLRGGSADLDQLSGYYKNDTGYYSDNVSSISGKYRMGDYK